MNRRWGLPCLLCICLLPLSSFKKPGRRAAMPGRFYQLAEMGGLCTRNLYFINDSLYSFEGGCEASSHHHFGRWRQRSDTFTFTCDTSLFINPVIRIKARKVPGDSVVVRVQDEKGVVIQYFKVAVRTGNGGVRIAWYDETDSVHKCPRPGPSASLRLYSLEKGYSRPFILSADSGNYLEVTLRIPPNIPLGGWSGLSYDYPFSLILHGDSLVSFGPEWGGRTAVFNRLKQ